MPPKKRSGTGTQEKTINNHQAGLAPPGRRIQKQKSSSSLNGHLKASASANGLHRSQPVHPDAAVDDPSTPAPPSSDAHVNAPAPDDAKMGAGQSHSEGRLRAVSGAADGDLEAHGSCNGTYGHPSPPLTIDVKAASGTCAPSRHEKSIFSTATTILKACPLWDVIAILIILLQLPPTVVNVVQSLFALLTFVTPVSGISLSNLPSLNEILSGSSGAPSLQTIVLVDTAMFVAFVCAWTPAQNLALDLAQAVIAISLGGAAASKGGTSNSIFCCLAIIGFSHVIRLQFARQIGINAIWAGLIKIGFRPPIGPPSMEGFPNSRHASNHWLNKVVGVHILTQGVVRLVRRWYLYSAAMNDTNKKIDPEIGSFSTLNTPRTTSSVGDSGPDAPSSASTDGRPPGPSPAAREKDRISNSKKKKKQANHVRSQQPFWAALANAKVTFLKELEHAHPSVDLQEAGAENVVHIGNANFRNGMERVWIKEVGPTDISFGVSLPSIVKDAEEEDVVKVDSNAKRFRLRLNRTDWSSTRINSECLGIEAGDLFVDEWSAKIFGLTPSTNYICEFIRVDDGAVFCTTHITTQPAPSTEQAPTPPAVQTQSLRPLSPKTTLKNSIQAAEQQLEASKNRLKRNKRDHKNTLTGLQKDVDSLNSRLSSNGGNDDRLRQKARQLEQSLQQAKAKESEIFTQIEDLGDMPADEKEEASAQRASWRLEKDRLSRARKAHDSSKAEADREVAQVKSDISTLKQKHQKFEQRQTKYNEQHDQLISETSQTQEAQARYQKYRAGTLQWRAEEERRYIDQAALCDRETAMFWSRASQAEQESKALEDLYSKNLSMQSVPVTPEGPLPGTRNLVHQTGFPPLNSGFQFPPPGFNHNESTNNRSNPASLYREGRGRSSSMLSGVSGFTDDLDDYPVKQHVHISHYKKTNGAIGSERRKSSSGSGSSGSGQSSTRDPMSPLPQIKSMASPVIGYNGNSPLSPPGHGR